MQVVPRRQPGPTKQQDSGGGRHFEIRLSATVLALVAVLIAATVGWSFVMGFIVGRGDDPGERIAKFDPFVRSAELNPAVIPAQAANDKKGQESEEKDKGADKPTAEPPKKSDEKSGKAEIEQPHPFARPRENAGKAWGVEDVRVLPKDGESAESESSDRTEYFYQVASYRKKAEAEALSKKLAGKRSRSYVQQNGSLFSVYLNIKANDREYSELQSLFAKLRVKGPRLMARKGQAVPGKKGKAATDQKQPKDAKEPSKTSAESSRKPAQNGANKPSETSGKANRAGGTAQARPSQGSRKATGPGEKNAGETEKNKR